MRTLSGENGAYWSTLRSDRYHEASADEKREILWQIVVKSRYPELPKIEFSQYKSMARAIYLQILRRPFITAEDVRPPRTKLFHPWGAGVKVRFDADGDSPYTGLFETGATGLARLSIAMTEDAYVPGMALKLLVDGRPSENVVLVPGLDPQPNRDFFAPPITNILAPPQHPPFSEGWKLAYWWMSFAADPLGQPVDHIAAVKRNGEPVLKPVAPTRLCFRAPEGLSFDPDTRKDFRDLLAELPPGTEIYRMFAQPGVGGQEEVYVGSVTTESEIVASSFVDHMLAFQHARDPHGPYQKRFGALKAVVNAVALSALGAAVYELGRRSRRR
jgi:hypothetical protein